MNIEGSVAVVTGASAGIGREIALELARRGAEVHAVARREEQLTELADEVGGIKPLVADVTDPADRDRIVREPGTIDILVNNAGAGWAGAFVDMTADDVERLVQLNLVAQVELCRRIAPDMVAQGRGHIVNMARCSASSQGRRSPSTRRSRRQRTPSPRACAASSMALVST